MEVEPSPVLEAQRQAHPELGDAIDELQKFQAGKLYHQLTQALLKYLASPPFAAPSAAAELLEFFNSFIKPYEKKFDQVYWVQILAIVSKPQTPDGALELLGPFEALVEKNKSAKQLWLTVKAEKLTLAGQKDAAKDILDTVGKEIEEAYEVPPLIQSEFHKTNAMLWKTLGRPQEFYESSLKYLAFTPLASIPEKEQAKLAFEIGLSSLVAEEEFNFGELLKQDILKSLDGTSTVWIKDLLQAFGEGRFDLFDGALQKHRAQIDATPELKSAEESVLRPKMKALALMELAFRQPKKGRRLTFEAIAQHCRVAPKEVEALIMKSMCNKLIRGSIDEVKQVVAISWVKPRILDMTRITLMKQHMDEWSVTTGALLDHLEEMTPELLVS
jgi:26S proteasome regulatory subunit N9